MKATRVSVTEAVRHFSEYVSRIAYRHESFVLVKGKRPVAELKPLPLGTTLADLPDLLASLPSLPRKEAKAFAKDVRQGRRDLRKERLRDPWVS